MPVITVLVLAGVSVKSEMTDPGILLSRSRLAGSPFSKSVGPLLLMVELGARQSEVIVKLASEASKKVCSEQTMRTRASSSLKSGKVTVAEPSLVSPVARVT